MKITKYILPLVLALGITSTKANSPKNVSVTISPLHLAAPIFEATAEYRVNSSTGLSGILGFGTFPLDNYFGEKEDLPILEVGAQLAYYVLGNFGHGLQLGAEVLWVKVDFPEKAGVTVNSSGLAVGPMLGYKHIASFGFTTLIQFGYQRVLLKANAENQFGQEAEFEGNDWIPLLNINFGWSF